MPLASRNVFLALEAEFTASPVTDTVVLRADECGKDLPSHGVRLREMRDLLDDPRTDPRVCAATWVRLVRNAQALPSVWEYAALWAMLPKLRGITQRLYHLWQVDVQDIRSDVIVGFLEALRRVDPERPNLRAHLWWSAFRHAHEACRQATRLLVTPELELVAAGIDAAGDAVFGRTAVSRSSATDRLSTEGERLGALAARMGLRERVRAGWRDGGGNRENAA